MKTEKSDKVNMRSYGNIRTVKKTKEKCEENDLRKSCIEGKKWKMGRKRQNTGSGAVNE